MFYTKCTGRDGGHVGHMTAASQLQPLLALHTDLGWSNWTCCLSPFRHPRCSPFKALRVLLVFEKPVELWAQLITMGGASSVRQLQADQDSSGTGPPTVASSALRRLILTSRSSVCRRSCWQVRRRGDRPRLSAAAAEKPDVTGGPAGVS